MDEIIMHYYPELNEFQEDYFQVDSKIKLLVLGGSAVNINYCDLATEIPLAIASKAPDSEDIRVFNLAQFGQTTLDSRIKMDFLKDYHFDYVFVYHGINDTRANNIPAGTFDENYRHFAYYDEVYVCNTHPEKKYFVLPYTLHYLFVRLKDNILPSPKVPPYYIVVGDSVYNKSFWEEGREVKTAATFKSNLESIINTATHKDDSKVILFTYANYTAPGYSLHRFFNKELDYTEQKWPTEIYGDPENVATGIAVHNDISRSLSRGERVLFSDFADSIPHSAAYFHDICHLTENGCRLMAGIIADLIINDNIDK